MGRTIGRALSNELPSTVPLTGRVSANQLTPEESEIRLKTRKMARNFLAGTLTHGLAVLIGGLYLAVSPIGALGQDPPQEKQRESNKQQASVSDQQIPPAIAKELDAMKRRIEQLETELKRHQAAEQ